MKTAVLCFAVCFSVAVAAAQKPSDSAPSPSTPDRSAASPTLKSSSREEASEAEVPPQEGVADRKTSFWADWPSLARKAAARIYDKYGGPDGVLPGQVVWENEGPWLRIAVFKDPVQHNFPLPHLDVVEHEIAYPVQADKLSELAQFNGSIVAARTRGTLTVRGPSEAMNLLALNLAHEIITEATTVEAARRTCAGIVQQLSQGTVHPYLQDLQFRVAARGGTGDPDEAVLPQPPVPGVPSHEFPDFDPASAADQETSERSPAEAVE
jgi:hypothetical protein